MMTTKHAECPRCGRYQDAALCTNLAHQFHTCDYCYSEFVIKKKYHAESEYLVVSKLNYVPVGIVEAVS